MRYLIFVSLDRYYFVKQFKIIHRLDTVTLWFSSVFLLSGNISLFVICLRLRVLFIILPFSKYIRELVNKLQLTKQTNLATSITVIRCDALEPLPNGNYTFSVAGRPGTFVVYSCDEGYRLVGNLGRQCSSNGMWTGSTPTCISMIKTL